MVLSIILASVECSCPGPIRHQWHRRHHHHHGHPKERSGILLWPKRPLCVSTIFAPDAREGMDVGTSMLGIPKPKPSSKAVANPNPL